MIGYLPTTLNVGGIDYDIRWDYYHGLLLLQALSDVELDEYEKAICILTILYKQEIPPEFFEEAIEKATWFLNIGGDIKEPTRNSPRLYDWDKDEQMIFSAINKVAGFEVRMSKEPIHFWTFIGYFQEIDDKTRFANIVNIRSKRARGKKLEKYEQDFYRQNKEIIDLPKHYTKQELDDIKAINEMLGIDSK